MADAQKTTQPQPHYTGNDLPGGGTTTVTTDGTTNVKDAAGVVTSSTPPGFDEPHK